MIIGISLCRPSIGSFFTTKTITTLSSTMTITNGFLVDNYVPKSPFMAIMCQNDGSLRTFFSSFFGNGGSSNNNNNNDDVYGFSFLLQCSFLALLTCFELASNIKVFFMDTMLLWEKIQIYGGE